MTVFEKFKSKNIDELAEWLDEYCMFDDAPWIHWWDKNYCNNCDGIWDDINCYAWCELNDDKCKFFQDMDYMPDNKQIIKMWLESECL